MKKNKLKRKFFTVGRVGWRDYDKKQRNSEADKKMVKGNFMQDDLGGGGDRLSPGKTLCAEFITELTHKRTKGIILRLHLIFPK